MAASAASIRASARVLRQGSDVWSIINAAAAASPVQPVVNLGQGFFGYNPPQFLRDAVKKTIEDDDCHQYAPPRGHPSMTHALSQSYSPLWGRQLDPDREILVTTGANEGMLSAFMAFLDPGDQVIVFEPVFDQYISNIEMAGGTVVYVGMHPPSQGAPETSSGTQWTIDFEAFTKAITPKTKMIVLNSPHNPTGLVLSRKDLEAIGDVCIKHNILILSDEVYDRLSYVPFNRIATLSPELANLTLTVGSAGKSFWATGWRVGWLIGPEHLIKHCVTAHTRICYCSVAPLQKALAVGLEQTSQSTFWDDSKADMLCKMKTFNEVWDELGISYSEPSGGYMVLVDFSKVKLPEDYAFPSALAGKPLDFKLAWFLIMEIGVAGIPVSAFYRAETQHQAPVCLRFAVCKNIEVLQEAKKKLRGLKEYIQTQERASAGAVQTGPPQAPAPTRLVYESLGELRSLRTKVETARLVSSLDERDQRLFKHTEPNDIAISTTETIFHVQGGGQPSDTGSMRLLSSHGEGGQQPTIELETLSVRRGVDGTILHHVRGPDAAQPPITSVSRGAEVQQTLNGARRDLCSRIHSGGHILGFSVRQHVPGANETKGQHFMPPEPAFVEFRLQGTKVDESLQAEIQSTVDELVARDLGISVSWIAESDLMDRQINMPEGFDFFVPALSINGGNEGGKADGRMARCMEVRELGGYPCSGTHTDSTGKLGKVAITKVSSKKGHTKFYYEVQ